MRFTTTPIAAVHLTFHTQTAFIYPEDGGSTYLSNISTHIYNTAYKPKRTRSTVFMFPYFPHSSSPVCPQHCSCNTVTATYHCNQHTNFQNPQPHTSLPHTRTHHQKSQAHFPFSLSKGIAPFHTVLYMYCCMLMQCLRQGPVFLPSSINSYCQTTANSNM